MVERQVHFITAANSIKNNSLVRGFSNLSKAIPVERPQDNSISGKGTITKIKNSQLIGKGTKFTEIDVKSAIKVGKQELKIKKVLNDEEIVLESPCLEEISSPHSYTILPKL